MIADALLKLVPFDSPTLRAKAAPVTDHEAAVALGRDMIDAAIAYGGVGLAANQVGNTTRVVVVQTMYNPDRKGFAILINPEWKPAGAKEQTATEGCLSLSVTRQVSRARRISVKYTNAEGEHVTRVAFDMEARIIQHECDHLDGVLITDK